AVHQGVYGKIRKRVQRHISLGCAHCSALYEARGVDIRLLRPTAYLPPAVIVIRFLRMTVTTA
ncbi:MAG: hypothetical protein ACREBW_10600, partial [Candidatus Micrarchaeaceae archaeon]